RDVVWDPDQVKKLISSIFSRYPCGSLILWEPRQKDSGLVRSMIRPERLPKDPKLAPKYFLLDGQQRLTALASVILQRSTLQELLAEVEEDMPYITCDLKKFPDDLQARSESGGYPFPWLSLQEVLDGNLARRED